jgi:hypothetical protein
LPALYRIFAREHDLTESHVEDITQEHQVETSAVPQHTS